MGYLFLNLLFNSALASTQPGVIPILPPDVFSWAIGIGLLLALGSIIYAGIMYIVSAGNQSHQKESMDRIKGAVFGLILLISGWLILYTLNPDILRTGTIKIPEITTQRQETPP